MPAQRNIVLASEVITDICRVLRYSRAHVAKLLREHHVKLRARRRTKDGRWVIPVSSTTRFFKIVQSQSGHRYKLGERGPHE